ncbi:MAG: hypothetical protein BWY70_00582 [Bacteroidetes bacterium ADurb.Bin408]|nr:MAG: hypothetical protein BWY70_00582 [Bacteroidetes bacterium ADurb.Bin408]
MMKKLLLSLIIVPFLGISVAISQCTPNPAYTNPGIYPDSATGLPHAYANVYYETTMTCLIPADTNISGYTVPIDSIGIVSFTGLPTGFTYTPNRPSGYWPGGTAGCVLIAGQNNTVGTYPLTINLMGYASGISVPFTLSYYKIIIDSTQASIQENTGKNFEVYQNNPNPFIHNTEISFNSDVNGIYNVEVFNMIGKVVYNEPFKAQKGLNKINFNASEMPQGIYFYKISNGNRSYTKRMIVASR